MPHKKNSIRLSKIIFWNFLLVFFEFFILIALEVYFLKATVNEFSEVNLNQHITSQEKTLQSAIRSMSFLISHDASEGLIKTGHFDRIEIIDDFGNRMTYIETQISPTIYSNIASSVFQIEITRELTHKIEIPHGGAGIITTRANLTNFISTQVKEIILRTILLAGISLTISLGGTTYLVTKIHKGASELAKMATDISASNHLESSQHRHFHFLEFDFVADQLNQSVEKLRATNALLLDAKQKRQDSEDSYQFTLQSLKLYSRYMSKRGEVLYSNIEGMNNHTIAEIFNVKHDNIRNYISDFKQTGHETNVISHEMDVSAEVSEQLKVQVDIHDNSWLVQISLRADGRLLLISSDISEVRLSDRRRFHREKIEALGRISSNVAHEFNNMLNIMLNSIEAAKEPRAEMPALLDTAQLAGQRAQDVVKRLQQLSRDQAISQQNVNMHNWLDAAKTLMQATVGPRIKLHISCPETAMILADPSAMDAIIVNLCKNAADAIAGTGDIYISILPHSIDNKLTPDLNPNYEYYRLCFEDTGPGINEENLSKIFEPYFTTKERYMGTGLGLSETKTMLNQMNGDIYFSSQSKGGAQFNLILQKGEMVESSGVLKAPNQSAPDLVGLSVIIVEDELLLSKLWSSYLSTLGVSVVSFSNIRQARSFLCAHEKQIDVAILDNTLPDGYGSELIKDIRNSCPDCRCISVSGEPQTHLRDSYDNHATKPITLTKLHNLVSSEIKLSEDA